MIVASVVVGLLLWVLAAGLGGPRGALVASVLSIAIATIALVGSGMKT